MKFSPHTWVYAHSSVYYHLHLHHSIIDAPSNLYGSGCSFRLHSLLIEESQKKILEEIALDLNLSYHGFGVDIPCAMIYIVWWSIYDDLRWEKGLFIQRIHSYSLSPPAEQSPCRQPDCHDEEQGHVDSCWGWEEKWGDDKHHKEHPDSTLQDVKRSETKKHHKYINFNHHTVIKFPVEFCHFLRLLNGWWPIQVLGGCNGLRCRHRGRWLLHKHQRSMVSWIPGPENPTRFPISNVYNHELVPTHFYSHNFGNIKKMFLGAWLHDSCRWGSPESPPTRSKCIERFIYTHIRYIQYTYIYYTYIYISVMKYINIKIFV